MRRRRGRRQYDEAVAARLSRLIEPALLYLLARGVAAHGYDLLGEVNEMGLTETQVDAGAIYRALRQLEEEGAVVSAWDTSGGGPARRNYELTELGRAKLASWVQVIERRAVSMASFVEQARAILTP